MFSVSIICIQSVYLLLVKQDLNPFPSNLGLCFQQVAINGVYFTQPPRYTCNLSVKQIFPENNVNPKWHRSHPSASVLGRHKSTVNDVLLQTKHLPVRVDPYGSWRHNRSAGAFRLPCPNRRRTVATGGWNPKSWKYGAQNITGWPRMRGQTKQPTNRLGIVEE